MPAYNEAQSIANAIREVTETLDHERIEFQLIVADDGSSDNTREQVLPFTHRHSNISIVSYPNNEGKGYALKYGYQFTHGELVLFLY